MQFHDVIVTSFLPYTHEIHWTMVPDDAAPSPVYFYVETAPSPEGEWELLNPDDPVVNDCVYTDNVRKHYGTNTCWYYRVKAYVADELVATSCPAASWNGLTGRDRLIAKEIIRKELLYCRMAGVAGQLLQQRLWGERCPDCLDWDTDERAKVKCPSCYGTGFKYGYYNAVDLCIVLSQLKRGDKTSPIAGVTDNHVTLGRSIAYPYLRAGDVWVGTGGRRYIIQAPIEEVARFKGVPLVVQYPLIEAPASDIVYSIPLTQDTEPESSSSESGYSSSSMPDSPFQAYITFYYTDEGDGWYKRTADATATVVYDDTDYPAAVRTVVRWEWRDRGDSVWTSSVQEEDTFPTDGLSATKQEYVVAQTSQEARAILELYDSSDNLVYTQTLEPIDVV